MGFFLEVRFWRAPRMSSSMKTSSVSQQRSCFIWYFHQALCAAMCGAHVTWEFLRIVPAGVLWCSRVLHPSCLAGCRMILIPYVQFASGGSSFAGQCFCRPRLIMSSKLLTSLPRSTKGCQLSPRARHTHASMSWCQAMLCEWSSTVRA